MSDPMPNDDTTRGAVTQGGRGGRRGHSIWWVGAAVIAAIALLLLWAGRAHRHAPAERGTVPVSGAATPATDRLISA